MPDITLKRGVQRVEVQSSVVTTETLRRTFRVDPQEVWLRGDIDNRAYFPDEDGDFNLADVMEGALVSVEGSEQAMDMSRMSASTVSSAAQSAVGGSSASYQSTPTSSAFRSIVPTKSCKSPTASVKIVKAIMESTASGKISFNQEAQVHFDVFENTANVDHLLKQVKQVWGDGYVLVTINGLKLEDCEGTRGLKFWKSPRRKIYAVHKTYLKGKSPRKRSFSESDSEDEPASKRSKISTAKIANMVDDVKEDMFRTESKVEEVKETLDTVKRDIRDIMHLDRTSKIPTGLKCLLKSTFQCHICLGIPITPPVVMSKCCKTIIGCEACINQWYSGSDALTKTCPNCRVECGYSETLVLRGLDSFLNEAKEVIGLRQIGSDSDSD